MIDPPFFPVATPQAFYELLRASGSKDPDAMKNFAAAHPEFAAFGAWAKSAPWTASYAEERLQQPQQLPLRRQCRRGACGALVAAAGGATGRRSRPTISPSSAPTYLEQDIAERVAKAPQRWTMVVTVANPGDPTADPSKAWPEGRRTVEVGTLVVQQIEAERDGPCRDINFDPTVLPTGITDVGRSVPGRAILRLREVVRPAHGGSQGLSLSQTAAGDKP